MPKHRSPLVVLVLAAGQGKRLRSKTTKLVHPLAGRPMARYAADAATALKPDLLVAVVGHQSERVREALGDHEIRFVTQREQRGTGHAVSAAARALEGRRDATLLVFGADQPAIQPATLRRLVARHRRSGAALSLLSVETSDAVGRARVIRDDRGNVERVVPDRGAPRRENCVVEVDCGIYCAKPGILVQALRRLGRRESSGERHVADAVADLIGRGEKVLVVPHHDAGEVLGVDTRQELARVARLLYARKAEELQSKGVTLLDAERTWIDPRASIGRDSVIYPGVLIEGACRVGEDCLIGPGCHLTDVTVGRGAQILDHCVMIDSAVGRDALVGPFARLRPGSVLEAGSRVGNFVELKKTRLGPGSKANHLAYLGDSTIGPSCNIGAGTITCNYDGTSKHPTIMGRGVFIGSDTQLVAPVTLGDGAYVGAGATITKDVPAGALALSRQPQKNIEGWVARRLKKSKKK
jgi:bifunctional UDP-N-acetylglucosamine pyrophosphorylase/glucosamine-1-phosphate N-acetyltransferase